MTNIIAACVVWIWAAGSTNTLFEFYANGVLVEVTSVPQAVLCQEDIPFYHAFDVWVIAVDANGRRSPIGVPGLARWINNTDFDGDGITGVLDFGRFGPWYGSCNDGRKIIPCS